MATLGQILKGAREEQKVTREDLAIRTRMTEDFIKLIEEDKRDVAVSVMLQLIAGIGWTFQCKRLLSAEEKKEKRLNIAKALTYYAVLGNLKAKGGVYEVKEVREKKAAEIAEAKGHLFLKVSGNEITEVDKFLFGTKLFI